MSRLILIVVIIALVYWLLTAPRRQQRKQEQQQQPPKNAQDMVSCAQCGLHLPKSESVFADGKYFCSTAHSLGQKGS